jgi:RNA polymerase subunit RPABC4/transcription elongation factor Spt4
LKGEGSKVALWDNPPILPLCVGNNGSRVQIAATVSSSTAVDALSNQMVTNIMQEVTRSNNVDSGSSADSTPAELFRQESDSGFGAQKQKWELELEGAFIKMGFIQFGAMKALSAILNCSHFAEFILVPKRRKTVLRPSTSEGKEKDEGNSGGNNNGLCPKCGKMIPMSSEDCPYCSETSSLQAALAEAFSAFVTVIISMNQVNAITTNTY